MRPWRAPGRSPRAPGGRPARARPGDSGACAGGVDGAEQTRGRLVCARPVSNIRALLGLLVVETTPGSRACSPSGWRPRGPRARALGSGGPRSMNRARVARSDGRSSRAPVDSGPGASPGPTAVLPRSYAGPTAVPWASRARLLVLSWLARGSFALCSWPSRGLLPLCSPLPAFHQEPGPLGADGASLFLV
jgi:hypothetical protein